MQTLSRFGSLTNNTHYFHFPRFLPISHTQNQLFKKTSESFALRTSAPSGYPFAQFFFSLCVKSRLFYFLVNTHYNTVVFLEFQLAKLQKMTFCKCSSRKESWMEILFPKFLIYFGKEGLLMPNMLTLIQCMSLTPRNRLSRFTEFQIFLILDLLYVIWNIFHLIYQILYMGMLWFWIQVWRLSCSFFILVKIFVWINNSIVLIAKQDIDSENFTIIFNFHS